MTQPAARHVSLLGPSRVDAADIETGAVPRFRSRRTLGLLGFLAAGRRPIAREQLAALFWPDEEPARGRSNLSRELHNLAQILPGCWRSDRQTVEFIPSAGTTVDIDQLRQLEAQERWEEATGLLGGEFLEGLNLGHNLEFERWLLDERERWRAYTAVVLRRVIEGHTRRGRYSGALNHAQHLLRLAPWDEAAHRQIMRLLAWTGQRGAALRQFEICKKALWQELDVEPALETIDLYRQIQAGKFTLPPQIPAFLTEEKPRHTFEQPPFVGRRDELAQLDAFMANALAGKGRVMFITGGPGRGKTALLDAFARQAMEKYPKLLVAGGKCSAYSGLGDPYLPYRDMMAMLTGDTEGRWDAGDISRDHARRLWDAFSLTVRVLLEHGPHLLDVFVPGAALLSRFTAAAPADEPWLLRLRNQVRHTPSRYSQVEQSHLFQQFTAVLRAVAQEQPLLLILDDIQWADAASISLLFHLGRRLTAADSRILIACAYRAEEVALGRAGQRHPLAKVLGELKRTLGDVWIDLGWAEESRGRRFLGALLDAEPNRLSAGFRAALFDRTGGHPLFSVELLRTMKERGNLLQDEAGAWIEGPTLDWEVIPARVEAVIEERIDRLDPDLQRILAVASVEGELFTTQVIAEVRNMSEWSTLVRLSQDLERQHRLVREQEEVYASGKRLSRYRFSHVLIQDFVYKRLSLGERRLLHGDVAAALEALHADQLDEITVQLAHHYFQACDYGSAYRCSAQAGERAARLYENGEAIIHFTRAIQLAETADADAISLTSLYRGRGLASERLGEFDQAHVDYTAALQLASATGQQQVEGRVLLDLGRLWAARDHDQARAHFQEALALARLLGDTAFLANSLNWMSNWHLNDDNRQEAVTLHQEALAIFEELGHRSELAKTLDLLGIANLLGGDFNNSVHYYNRAVILCRELDDRLRLASSLLGRASAVSMLVIPASVAVGLHLDPVQDIKEARRVAVEIGSASNRIWAHWSMGLLHTMHGHFGSALKQLQEALQAASQIKHREWVVASRFALGLLYAGIFAPDQALTYLEGGLVLAEELRSPLWIYLTSGALAGVYLSLDDLSSAQARLDAAISPQTPMDTLGKRCCWVRRAELALSQDEPKLALDLTDRLIASACDTSPGCVITYLWHLKAEALAAAARPEQAISLLRTAKQHVEKSGERNLLWRVHASLGRILSTLGHREKAEQAFSSARAHIGELSANIPDEKLKQNFRCSALGTLNTRSSP